MSEHKTEIPEGCLECPKCHEPCHRYSGSKYGSGCENCYESFESPHGRILVDRAGRRGVEIGVTMRETRGGV